MPFNYKQPLYCRRKENKFAKVVLKEKEDLSDFTIYIFLNKTYKGVLKHQYKNIRRPVRQSKKSAHPTVHSSQIVSKQFSLSALLFSSLTSSSNS